MRTITPTVRREGPDRSINPPSMSTTPATPAAPKPLHKNESLKAESNFLRDAADTREQSSGDAKIPTDKFALRFVKP